MPFAVLLAFAGALGCPTSTRQLRAVARVAGELHRRAVEGWRAGLGVYDEGCRPAPGVRVMARGVRIDATRVQEELAAALRAVTETDDETPLVRAEGAVVAHVILREAATAEIQAQAADRAADEAGTLTRDTTTLRFVTIAPLRLAAA